MIAQVLKFRISQGDNEITVTEGSKVVEFNSQGPQLFVWIEVPMTDNHVKIKLKYFGTGFEVDTEKWSYLKTTHHFGFVWHLYEAK